MRMSACLFSFYLVSFRDQMEPSTYLYLELRVACISFIVQILRELSEDYRARPSIVVVNRNLFGEVWGCKLRGIAMTVKAALSEGEFLRGCPGTLTTVLLCVLTMLSVLSVRSIKCLS